MHVTLPYGNNPILHRKGRKGREGKQKIQIEDEICALAIRASSQFSHFPVFASAFLRVPCVLCGKFSGFCCTQSSRIVAP
ncbi:MAG: hypothetical protein ABI648_16540 [Betaproteobacteria bacterium]